MSQLASVSSTGDSTKIAFHPDQLISRITKCVKAIFDVIKTYPDILGGVLVLGALVCVAGKVVWNKFQPQIPNLPRGDASSEASRGGSASGEVDSSYNQAPQDQEIQSLQQQLLAAQQEIKHLKNIDSLESGTDHTILHEVAVSDQEIVNQSLDQWVRKVLTSLSQYAGDGTKTAAVDAIRKGLETAREALEGSSNKLFWSSPYFPTFFGTHCQIRTLCLDAAVSSEIGSLSQLEVLKVSSKKAKEIPEEIGLLQNLRVLDLRGCKKLKTLHENIKDLPNLELINLRGCSYLPDKPPEWFGELDLKIKILMDEDKLDAWGVTQRLAQQMEPVEKRLDVWVEAEAEKSEEARASANAVKAAILDCLRCGEESLSLECNGVLTLPEEITQLSGLKELNIESNTLISLPNSLGTMKTLEKFKAKCSVWQQVPLVIFNLDGLKILNLSGCILLRELPPEIGQLGQLKEIYLRNTLRNEATVALKDFNSVAPIRPTLPSNNCDASPIVVTSGPRLLLCAKKAPPGRGGAVGDSAWGDGSVDHSSTWSAASLCSAAAPVGIRRMAFLPSLISNSSPGSRFSMAV